MLILGIESSCDETACAVVRDGREVLSNIVASQIEEHKLYGGVVPEIASRRHAESITAVWRESLEQAGVTMDDIDAVAVTAAPGLIGCLLVGVNFAKGLCMASEKPLVPVHHLRGHLAANYIAHPELKPPYIALIASGGHSHVVKVNDYTRFEVLGKTADDAAGEAFDKVARTLGFDYPGGVYLDKAAALGDPQAFRLPTPNTPGPYDFSFSGLKTAVINLVHNAQQKGEKLPVNDIAASFQHRVVEILSDTLMRAAGDTGIKTVAVAGGVCANSGLRRAMEEKTKEQGMQLYMPPLNLCGDNAAMIAAQGYFEYISGARADMSLNARASMPVDNMVL